MFTDHSCIGRMKHSVEPFSERSMPYRISLALAFFILSVSLTACGLRDQDIQSTITQNQKSNIGRMLVVADVGDALNKRLTNNFSMVFVDTLQACGIATHFRTFGPLDLEDPVPEEMRQFKPDAIMKLNWRPVFRHLERNNPIGGYNIITGYVNVIMGEYTLSLIDAYQNKEIWNSIIYPGGFWNINTYPKQVSTYDILPPKRWYNVRDLSDLIINQLVGDHIIPSSCRVSD